MSSEKYKIVEDSTSEGLTRQVEELIHQGWTPTGGVSHTIVPHQWSSTGSAFISYKVQKNYAQAMIKN